MNSSSINIANEFLNSSQNYEVDQMDKIDTIKIMEKYGNFKAIEKKFSYKISQSSESFFFENSKTKTIN